MIAKAQFEKEVGFVLDTMTKAVVKIKTVDKDFKIKVMVRNHEGLFLDSEWLYFNALNCLNTKEYEYKARKIVESVGGDRVAFMEEVAAIFREAALFYDEDVIKDLVVTHCVLTNVRQYILWRLPALKAEKNKKTKSSIKTKLEKIASF